MFKWSKRSNAIIQSCDERLQRVVNRALSFQHLDITCIEGYRTIERQQELYRLGKSKLDGIENKSKHNFSPSYAIDIAPITPGKGIDWDNKFAFHILAGLMFAAAGDEGVRIRWGGDWDGDFSNTDQTFNDLPHFELMDY